MFFFLSKTLDVAFDPWWWIVGLLVCASVALRLKRHQLGFVSLAAGLGVMVTLSLPAVSHRLWHGLEADAPNTVRADVTYDVVVLLGGAVTASGATPTEASWGDNVDRLIVTNELLRSGRARNVIVSGGEFKAGFPTEAEFLARQLEQWGVASERIIVESKALNTKQNAVFSKELIASRGFSSVLIVTSAFHMTRALSCFTAVGLTPDVLPVDYRMRAVSSGTWAPRTRNLNESAEALREWFGRAVYAVIG